MLPLPRFTNAHTIDHAPPFFRISLFIYKTDSSLSREHHVTIRWAVIKWRALPSLKVDLAIASSACATELLKAGESRQESRFVVKVPSRWPSAVNCSSPDLLTHYYTLVCADSSPEYCQGISERLLLILSSL